MKLSKNFTLKELTKTDTGLPNVPGEKETQFLLLLAIFILQPIRNRAGRLDISSGFRSSAVNGAIPGTSKTSQHPKGQAADIVPGDIDLFDLCRWIVNVSRLDFGQCIIYPDRGFIHISLPRLHKSNKQALICYEGEYHPYSEELLHKFQNKVRGS